MVAWLARKISFSVLCAAEQISKALTAAKDEALLFVNIRQKTHGAAAD